MGSDTILPVPYHRDSYLIHVDVKLALRVGVFENKAAY
jgi:hypothetical protein